MPNNPWYSSNKWDQFSEPVNEEMATDRFMPYIDKIRQWAGIESTRLQKLGGGSQGVAYQIGDKVVKITDDKTEAVAAAQIAGKQHPNVYEIYKVGRIGDDLYIIVYGYVNPPKDKMEQIAKYGNGIVHGLGRKKFLNFISDWTGPSKVINQMRKAVDGYQGYEAYMARLYSYFITGQQDYKLALEATKTANFKYFVDIMDGLKFLYDNGVWFVDVSSHNVMERNGRAVLIDVGYSNTPGASADKIEQIMETSEFQKKMASGHERMKKKIISTGGNKTEGGAFTEDPPTKRNKSAPPIGEAKNSMRNYMDAWAQFLKEEKEGAEPNAIADNLYHVGNSADLSSLIENGLTDYQDMNREKEGVSFFTEFRKAYGSQEEKGDMIVHFDGQVIQDSGEYVFENDGEQVIVSMRDEARMSGAGIDPKVDTLGTVIPFQFVTNIIFLKRVTRRYLDQIKKRFPALTISYYDKEKNKISELV
jgi:hypothetical protein